jgi:hypothetical protein
MLALTAVLGLVSLAAGAAADMNVARPEDTGEALVNPLMGWTMHFYSNIPSNYGSQLAPSDTLDDFPGLSTVYLRVPWSFVEPEEGVYNWSLLDTPAQRWIGKGGKVAFRISCSESWTRWATPEYVKAAGAKGHFFTPGQGVLEDGAYWEPDYNDPVFLEKLEGFLTAFAERYDGNPNVAFIDVGSFGVWGEGHTLASTQLTYDVDVLKKHIDLHVKHFPNTLLCISDDFAGHDAPGVHHEITDYALSQGVTLRDDSICVQPPPRSWYHDGMAGLFWLTLPVILEHEHYGGSKGRGAWGDGSLLLKAVEDYHASYLSIHWWPRELLEENRDIIRRINLRMGYRLQCHEVRWPATIRIGEPFTVTMRWANAGVAPCYPGGFPCVTLKDREGGIVSVFTAESMQLRDLPVAAPGEAESREVVAEFVVGRDNYGHTMTVPEGPCDVFISAGHRDGTPVFALPHPENDGHRRHRVGSVELVRP